MPRLFTIWALAMALHSVSGETTPIRGSLQLGQIVGREPVAVQSQTLTVRVVPQRKVEGLDPEKLRRDMARTLDVLRIAQERARRDMEQMTAKRLADRSGIGKKIEDGSIKQQDVDGVKRNLERAAEEMRRAVFRMDGRRPGGDK